MDQLYQLGDESFPPITSLNYTNLPVQASPLIGRASELDEVRTLVGKHRIVTIIGPGGCGKTRLALHVAAEAVDDFSGGVWWVPLAGVSEPELVAPTIAASARQLRAGARVGDRGSRAGVLLRRAANTRYKPGPTQRVRGA